MRDFVKALGPCGIFLICILVAAALGAFSARGK